MPDEELDRITPKDTPIVIAATSFVIAVMPKKRISRKVANPFLLGRSNHFGDCNKFSLLLKPFLNLLVESFLHFSVNSLLDLSAEPFVDDHINIVSLWSNLSLHLDMA